MLGVEDVEDEADHDQREKHSGDVENTTEPLPALASGIKENLLVGRPFHVPHYFLNSPGAERFCMGCFFILRCRRKGPKPRISGRHAEGVELGSGKSHNGFHLSHPGT